MKGFTLKFLAYISESYTDEAVRKEFGKIFWLLLSTFFSILAIVSAGLFLVAPWWEGFIPLHVLFGILTIVFGLISIILALKGKGGDEK
ncbi:MAG: hypothetical protein QXR87_06000 [Candidatus Hadarchaeales archaeon]